MDLDKAARDIELAAHKRRLALLRERAALQGLGRDPSIDIEIEDIEKRIADLEGIGVRQQDSPLPQAETRPWWEMLPPQASGDVIIATVGAGAQGVAVGKNIQQTLNAMLGSPTPTDRQIVQQGMAEISAVLERARGQLDPTIALMAEFQLKLLADELAKTEASETPSASAIVRVGDWLLDHLPQIAARLAGLFATSAVGRVISKAGEPALGWVRSRFEAT